METPPRQLILSLFGLYARGQGNWLPVRGLIALMADLGVDSAAVRSSVSRLKKRGVLTSQRRDGQAGYALAADTVEVVRAGDERIWARPRATADDGWLTVVFSVPESQRSRRHALRSLLARLGFGAAGPGVWVAPGVVYAEALDALQRQGLAEFTELFRGEYLGVARLSDRIAQWWDLERIGRMYAEFTGAYAPVREEPGGDADPRAAFACYVPMLTAWRRLPYLDPGLPLDVLPADWPGIAAEATFADLDRRLRPAAARHAHGILRPSGG